MKKKYSITIIGTAEIKIDDSVLKAASTDDWQKQHGISGEEDVIEHIAYNMIVNGCELSEIDGFADRENEEAILSDVDWVFD